MRKLRLKLFTYGLLTVILTLSLIPVFAAEPEVYQEEEVVVTATRTNQEKKETPGTTEVVTKEEIEASGANTASEVLEKNGLVVSTNGGTANIATVQLDGFSAGQTLVMVNGIPANTGSSGTVDLSYFPASGIQKIEIVHGPLSALYGSNALGGVVNIITDLTGDPQNRFSLSGGNDNTREAEFTVQQRNFGIAIGGLFTDGYRERSEANLGHLMAQYDVYQNQDGFLIMDLAYRQKDSQNPGSLSCHPIADEYSKSSDISARGQARYGGWLFDYKVFGQSIDYRYDESGSDPAKYQTNTLGLDFAGQYALGAHDLLNGFTLKRDDYDNTTTGNHTLNNGALFLQDQWKINGQWQLISGLRWDTGSVFSSPVSPRVSLIRQVSENLTLKLGYGKAFRAPTVNDLYYPADNYGCVGNPDLKPERSERYEISGELKHGTQLWSANLFESNVEDGIDWQYQNLKYMPVNVDKMKVNGIILSWQNQFNSFVNVGIRYSWTDKLGWNSTTADYTDDLNYFGSGQLAFNLNLAYKKWVGGLDWRFVSKRSDQSTYDSNNNLIPVKMLEYQLINLNFGYNLNSNISYQLVINNIFDKEYQIHYGYPMPGREIVFSMNTKF